MLWGLSFETHLVKCYVLDETFLLVNFKRLSLIAEKLSKHSKDIKNNYHVKTDIFFRKTEKVFRNCQIVLLMFIYSKKLIPF